MLEFLSQITYWHWFILGIGFLIYETLFPTVLLFLWPGLAALMIGVITTFVPQLHPIYQIGLWALLTFVFTTQWIDYRKANPIAAIPHRPTRITGQEYVGQQFTLQKPVIHGRGELLIDGKTFPVYAIDDYPAGTLVKVLRVEGPALRVLQIL